MKQGQSNLEYAREILSGKRITFSQIEESEFSLAAGEIIFKSKGATLLKKDDELFISAVFTGQIKNSLIYIVGVPGFRKLDTPVYGKTKIKNFLSYQPRKPIPADKVLKGIKLAGN